MGSLESTNPTVYLLLPLPMHKNQHGYMAACRNNLAIVLPICINLTHPLSKEERGILPCLLFRLPFRFAKDFQDLITWVASRATVELMASRHRAQYLLHEGTDSRENHWTQPSLDCDCLGVQDKKKWFLKYTMAFPFPPCWKNSFTKRTVHVIETDSLFQVCIPGSTLLQVENCRL